MFTPSANHTTFGRYWKFKYLSPPFSLPWSNLPLPPVQTFVIAPDWPIYFHVRSLTVLPTGRSFYYGKQSHQFSVQNPPFLSCLIQNESFSLLPGPKGSAFPWSASLTILPTTLLLFHKNKPSTLAPYCFWNTPNMLSPHGLCTCFFFHFHPLPPDDQMTYFWVNPPSGVCSNVSISDKPSTTTQPKSALPHHFLAPLPCFIFFTTSHYLIVDIY